MDFETQCDCCVMSCPADTVPCFALISLFFVLLKLIGWRQLSNFFNNLDTCIVAVVKVSDDTIQLIINWTITIYRQIMTGIMQGPHGYQPRAERATLPK